jgi:hypothetical protein
MANLFHRFLRTHQWIYEHSHGVLGHRLLFGNPTLLLRTTGRRSGLPRTTALTYARDGDCYLIVASNGGRAQPPSLTGQPEGQARLRNPSRPPPAPGDRTSLPVPGAPRKPDDLPVGVTARGPPTQ